MKEGDIVKEKITGWKVVLIRPYPKIWRLLDDKVWKAKVWVEADNNTGIWKYKTYHESELEEIEGTGLESEKV